MSSLPNTPESECGSPDLPHGFALRGRTRSGASQIGSNAGPEILHRRSINSLLDHELLSEAPQAKTQHNQQNTSTFNPNTNSAYKRRGSLAVNDNNISEGQFSFHVLL